MPAKCSICFHESRQKIDSLLLENAPLSRIAREYAVSSSAVWRHKRNHLAQPMRDALQARRENAVAYGNTLLNRAEEIAEEARTFLDQAKATNNMAHIDRAISRNLDCLELVGKLRHELATAPITFNITTHPDWIALRSAIISTLAVHPAALQDVLVALRALHDGKSPAALSSNTA